jgi:hypothetical protein
MDPVRELKRKYGVSEWLARRMLRFYDGNSGAAEHRLQGEDVGELERREREMARGLGENVAEFRECGRRDGAERAREDVRKGELAWVGEKPGGELCFGCGRHLTKWRVLQGCLCSAPRVPVKAPPCAGAEGEGYREGYNALMADHVRKSINPKFQVRA